MLFVMAVTESDKQEIQNAKTRPLLDNHGKRKGTCPIRFLSSPGDQEVPEGGSWAQLEIVLHQILWFQGIP